MKNMMRKSLAIFITLTMLLTVMPAGMCLAAGNATTGKVIYLAGDGVGNDSNDGSANAPFRTFQKACENMQAGTTIIVHKGIYTVKDERPTWKGTADNPITIKACDDPNCKVCAKDASLPGPVFTSKSDWTNSAEKASADFMVKLCNSSYVNMDGLYITGYTGAGIWPDGSDHINITNMNIWDIDDPADTAYGTEGILVTGTTDSTFKNLNIWDIGQSRRSQGDHGLYVGYGIDSCDFENIKVQDAPGGGIQFYSGENYDKIATNCTVKNCAFSGCKYGLILVDIEGFTIMNNTFYNSGELDMYFDWTAKDNLIQNNAFYNDRTEKYTDPKYGAQAPAIIGYTWNSVKKPDMTKTVTGNTFTNNMYQYSGNYPAICRYLGLTADGKNTEAVEYTPDKFVTQQNADDAGNRFTTFTEGTIGIASSIDKTGMKKGDAYEANISANAKKLIADALDISSFSSCVDKGLSTGAPATDILGRNRDAKVDIGAYEYQSGTAPVMNISLSNASISEKNKVGDSIGTFNETTGKTCTYSLVSGGGDNSSFTIDNNTLKANAIFNYSTKSTYSVIVAVSDGKNTVQKTFAINIVKDTSISDTFSLSNTSITEKNSVGAVIGTISAASDKTYTYSLVSDKGDNSSFTISGNTLKANTVFNYSTKSTYTVIVDISNGANTVQKTFTINIGKIASTGDTFSLSNASITEKNSVGAVIGTISAASGKTYTYSLVSGKGDNSLFTISGSTLKANAVFSYSAKPTYSVIVAISDGTTTEQKTFNITVLQSTSTGGNSSSGGSSSGGGSTSGGSSSSGGSISGGSSSGDDSTTGEPTGNVSPAFSDITNHWAKSAIEKIASKNIIAGYPDGTIKPDNQTTRAEFTSMIVRMMGLNTADTTTNFSDIKSSDWYAGAVSTSVKAGLINGLGDGKFAPNKAITREEAMVIISNVLTYLKVETKTDASVLSKFTDQNSISSWAKVAATNLVGYGVISGDAGKLNPQKNITRAEVCVILNSAMSLYNK